MQAKKQRSKSSRNWLQEHFSDKYVKQAQQQGLRARSAFKLIEINQKYKILRPNMSVVDLGASPGSWSEYASKIIGVKGKVIAVDLLPMQEVKNVTFIQGDFTDNNVVANILSKIDNTKVDVVLSDMAPNTTGIPDVDRARSIDLVVQAWEFAQQVLIAKGTFLAKVFQSQDVVEFVKQRKANFKQISFVKPDASRLRSHEVFLLMQDFISN